MSLTGNFIDAATALAWGLADEVVPHDQLLARASELARAMAEIPAATVAEVRRLYAAMAGRADRQAYAEEVAWSKRWMAERFDGRRLGDQRQAIMERGRSGS